MFSLFAPGYIKEAQLVLKNARKLLDYRKDILPAATRSEIESGIERLDASIRTRDREGADVAARHLAR